MIALDVEGYCHECDAFEPYVDTTIYSQDDSFAKYVRCTNAKRCANLVRYLKRQLEKETSL